MIRWSAEVQSVVDLDIGQGLIDSLGFVIAFGAPCRARLFLVFGLCPKRNTGLDELKIRRPDEKLIGRPLAQKLWAGNWNRKSHFAPGFFIVILEITIRIYRNVFNYLNKYSKNYYL